MFFTSSIHVDEVQETRDVTLQSYTCSLCKLFIINTVMYDCCIYFWEQDIMEQWNVFIKSNLFHIDLHKMFPLQDLISALEKQK